MVHSDFSVFDNHLCGACHGAWTNAFRLSQLFAQVPQGGEGRKNPSVFQVCISIGFHLAQFLSFRGRRRSIVGGTAHKGPVRSRRTVPSSRFLGIAIGGGYTSVFNASAAIALNAPPIKHVARFWIPTNGWLIVRALVLLMSIG